MDRAASSYMTGLYGGCWFEVSLYFTTEYNASLRFAAQLMCSVLFCMAESLSAGICLYNTQGFAVEQILRHCSSAGAIEKSTCTHHYSRLVHSCWPMVKERKISSIFTTIFTRVHNFLATRKFWRNARHATSGNLQCNRLGTYSLAIVFRWISAFQEAAKPRQTVDLTRGHGHADAELHVPRLRLWVAVINYCDCDWFHSSWE